MSDRDAQTRLADLALDQVEAARQELVYAPGRQVRFAPNDLHNIARYLTPGQFWCVAADTGMGKTTFCLSTINDWVERGVRVCLVPTELQDIEVRRNIACLRAGVDQQIAVENSWAEHPEGMDWLAAVDAELVRQSEPPWSDHLLVLPIRELSEERLLEAAREAADFGAQVFVVDHLDHLDFTRRDVWGMVGRIAQTMKHSAEEYGFTSVGFKQVGRNDAARGWGQLAPYMPPRIDTLQGGKLTVQNAVVVLGLYRPLRPDLTGKDGAVQIKLAREGVIPATDVLMANTMGVVTLKHRPQGRLLGRRCLLHLEHGRLRDRNDF